MPLILNGSTGISGTDGSAATPAVQGTDTNTGMFFPAADQIAFAEGGTEVMRLDASGNVGIGTSSPTARLDVTGPSSPEVVVRSTQAGSWKSRISFGNAARKWEIGSDINGVGNNDLYFYDAAAVAVRANITPTGDFQFNSGYGSVATAFGCRAWVNFNGTGTVAIRGSGNVSSITDNGVGDYTVNFATAMPDTNYAAVIGGGDLNTAFVAGTNRLSFPPATTAFRYFTFSNGGPQNDTVNTSVAIFR